VFDISRPFGSSDPLLNPAAISSTLAAEGPRHAFAFSFLEIGGGAGAFRRQACDQTLIEMLLRRPSFP